MSRAHDKLQKLHVPGLFHTGEYYSRMCDVAFLRVYGVATVSRIDKMTGLF